MAHKPIKYRAHNGYDTQQASEEAADIGPYGESLTVQSMAEDADINVLMKRYGITGKMPENPRIPTYGDFSNVTDYRTALQAVRNAHESFMEIPADIRARFNNDPQQFLEFTSDPGNLHHLVELGLAKARPPAPGSNQPAIPAPGPGAPAAPPPLNAPPKA